MSRQEMMEMLGASPADFGVKDLQQQYLSIVDNYLNETVKSRGYDNILSACSYADDDTDRVFQQEGIACRRWRSLVYRKCYDILDDVLAGKRALPTQEELLSELPKLEW